MKAKDSRKKPLFPSMDRTDVIVVAWAETCKGPGWANTPIWLIVRDKDGRLRQEAIQPENQTAEMLTLFDVSGAAASAMTDAVIMATGLTPF